METTEAALDENKFLLRLEGLGFRCGEGLKKGRLVSLEQKTGRRVAQVGGVRGSKAFFSVVLS